MTDPTTVSELFPSRWLKADDLERPVVVTIDDTAFEEIFDKLTRKNVSKLSVGFVGAEKRLIVNTTQAHAIWAITGTETFRDWPGHRVTLAPGRAHNGKATIVVTAAPNTPNPDDF